MMQIKIKIIFMSLLFIVLFSFPVFAGNIIINDECDLLTEEEENKLRNGYMSSISERGDVAFVTNFRGMSASNCFYAVFGKNASSRNCVLFYIDMKGRMLYIYI